MANKSQKLPPKEEEPRYKMPFVEVGMTVLWHDSPAAAPTAMALVTLVAQETVSLAILGPGYHNALVREGVRHVDHPDKELCRLTEMGVWSYTEAWRLQQLRYEHLLAAVEDLTGRLLAIEESVTKT